MSRGSGGSIRSWVAAGVAAGLAALAIPAPAAAQTARIALVIGNGAYTTLPPAPACGPAAKAMADKLRAVGYDVVTRTDVTTGSFDAAVGDFSARLAKAPGATAFIYVCARGASLNDRAFLLPVSVTLERPTDVFTQGILAKTLYDTLVRGKAGTAVVALDVAPQAGGAKPAGFDTVAQAAAIDGLAAITVIQSGADTTGTLLAQALVALLGRPTLDNGALVSAVQELLGTGSSTSIAVARAPKVAGPLVGQSAPPPAAATQPAPAPTQPAATPTQPAATPPPPPPTPAAASTPPATAPTPAPAAPPAPAAAPLGPEEHAMTLEDRRKVQEALGRLGYYAAPVDGVFGGDTRAAIRRYQMQLMEQPTGRLTPEQAGRLLSAR
ncbi:MAG: peptidoglycan-binding protein [Rhodospirillales bacterium]|nr:MAG: peptidoglycan-binding protein [Rhodospirillales bacterium]